MSRDVAVSGRIQLYERIPTFDYPEALVEAMIRVEMWHPEHGPLVFSPEVHALARTAIVRMRPAMRPIFRAEFVEWIRPMVNLAANPRGRAEMVQWFDDMLEAFDDLPNCVFSLTARKDVLRDLVFLPTPKVIADVVGPVAAAMTKEWNTLIQIAGEQ